MFTPLNLKLFNRGALPYADKPDRVKNVDLTPMFFPAHTDSL